MAMIEALFSQPNYLAAKKLLDATMLRHEAIASNLANVETPGYKRLDVAPTFQGELQRALAGQNAEQIASIQPKVATDTTAIARGRDGNTVQLEEEMMRLSQNTLAHALETQLITGNLARLRLAITGHAT